jgi:ABC-type glycerol-3-phosphate transport system permease component
MPIISPVGRKAWRVRLLTAVMYTVLAVLGVTMVVPFLITLTASVSNAMDYPRFAVVPRVLWSREERFVRGLVPYFPETLRGAFEQFTVLFAGVPATWTNWQGVGRDPAQVEVFARAYLAQAADPARWVQVRRQAADYDAFATAYPLEDSLCSINEQDVAEFYRAQYLCQVPATVRGAQREAAALQALGRSWGIPFESFYTVRPAREFQTPWDQPTFWPPQDGRAQDFTRLRQAYRERRFVAAGVRGKWPRVARQHGVTGPVSFPVTPEAPAAVRAAWARFTAEVTPLCETRPFPLKVAWLRYLGAPAQRATLGLPMGGALTIAEYNQAFGTAYATVRETPFPPGPDAPVTLRARWADFVQTLYPLRLIEVRVTPALTAQFRAFLQARFKGDLARCNAITGAQYADWSAVTLSPTLPTTNEAQGNLWMEFVAQVPVAVKRPQSAEAAYQRFLLAKYGSLEAINRQYGWTLSSLSQAEMPVDAAYLVTFVQNERPLFLASLGQNYRFVADYLVKRGRAVGNTVVLILLTLLCALTINPLAAYALSRFQMKQMPAVILFMLATMAFPAAVSMIPGYLLMRDLHLLNTYWALILPGVANGMSIFLLKGFFDSLPPELYEAAALDGAKEWQVFLRITLPLSKPILAVIALNSFMLAYNSWEWALVVCQNPKMWTMAVWLYQFNTTWGSQPWAVMASFVLASLPVFIMFLLCQNIILRGIILPQMK